MLVPLSYPYLNLDSSLGPQSLFLRLISYDKNCCDHKINIYKYGNRYRLFKGLF